MYKTRLNPPPANGWTPDLSRLTMPRAKSAPSNEVISRVEDLVLVAPEPPQPKLEFSPAPHTTKPQRLLINGEPAMFVRKRKENGKLFITARMDGSGEEKIFTLPPAKVKFLDDE